jgi:acyl carrier protein
MIEKTDILQFLEDELGVETDEIAGDTLLFSTGEIDSFALVTLMMFLETKGSFRINPADVTLDNLDSVDRIINFCRRHEAA